MTCYPVDYSRLHIGTGGGGPGPRRVQVALPVTSAWAPDHDHCGTDRGPIYYGVRWVARQAGRRPADTVWPSPAVQRADRRGIAGSSGAARHAIPAGHVLF
jgi:hypothetical protein